MTTQARRVPLTRKVLRGLMMALSIAEDAIRMDHEDDRYALTPDIESELQAARRFLDDRMDRNDT